MAGRICQDDSLPDTEWAGFGGRKHTTIISLYRRCDKVLPLERIKEVLHARIPGTFGCNAVKHK